MNRSDKPAKRGSSRSRHGALSNVGLAAFSILICLIALEAMGRVYYSHVAGFPLLGPVVAENVLDPVKGWKATPLFSLRETLQDAGGNSYQLVFNQQQDGFRLFQDLDRSPRILVVGDSFTQARHASDDKTWYAELARQTNAQVFAYGVGGYGTLQEAMAIEEFFGRIDPDAVILQACSNDVINNSLELERRSLSNNNLTVRPYADPDGRTFYALPARAGVLGAMDRIPQWMLESRLVRLLRGAAVKAHLRLFSATTVETAIAEKPSMPAYREALATTAALLARIKSAIGSRAAFAFVCDDRPPFSDDLRDRLRDAGFKVIPGIGEALTKARAAGREVRAADGAHWNQEGNAVVGGAVAAYLGTSYLSTVSTQ